MSDSLSRMLPFPPQRAAAPPPDAPPDGPPDGPPADKAARWPMQVSALGLYHQNIALRAQNAALKQALARQQAASSGPRSHWAAPPRDPLPAAPIPPPATAAQTGRGLTPRQRQVMALVLAGWPSKNIAADLAISQRTVENHRAAIMRRTGATSIPALARIVIGAAQSGDCMPAATRHSPAHDVPPIPAAPKASHAPD